MLISLTVGKVDAGIAILLTEDRRLIEFPSILLPSGISSGSIVDIQVSRNTAAEHTAATAFSHLQEQIFNHFGIHSPTKPQLRIRNATQTSVVLEWDPIDLATATLRSLTLYRNGAKAGSIPNPTTHTTTKISGLAIDTDYTFHLVLKTSAGTYTSDRVTVKTQKMTDLSGITVCPGVMPAEAREVLETTLARIGARKLQDYVRIDTTHFVCTEGRGQAWERATEMNIPVVRPEWIEACEREGRIVGVRAYYLNADPRLRPAVRDRRSMPPQPTTQKPVEGEKRRSDDSWPTGTKYGGGGGGHGLREIAERREEMRAKEAAAAGGAEQDGKQQQQQQDQEQPPRSPSDAAVSPVVAPAAQFSPTAQLSPAVVEDLGVAADGADAGDISGATKSRSEEGFETVPI